eukprot:9751-Eustigmatos_ZCMA.PRE.1
MERQGSLISAARMVDKTFPSRGTGSVHLQGWKTAMDGFMQHNHDGLKGSTEEVHGPVIIC